MLKLVTALKESVELFSSKLEDPDHKSHINSILDTVNLILEGIDTIHTIVATTSSTMENTNNE